jgi:hypothetical protein
VAVAVRFRSVSVWVSCPLLYTKIKRQKRNEKEKFLKIFCIKKPPFLGGSCGGF